MTLNKEVFVNNLEKIMELRGITKDDLAPQFMTEEQKKDCDYNSLSRIEKDNYKKKIRNWLNYKSNTFPDLKNLIKLCNILDCDINALLFKEDKPINKNNEEISKYIDMTEQSVYQLDQMNWQQRWVLSYIIENKSIEDILMGIFLYTSRERQKNKLVVEDLFEKTYSDEEALRFAEFSATQNFIKALKIIDEDRRIAELANKFHDLQIAFQDFKSRGGNSTLAKNVSEFEKEVDKAGLKFNQICDEDISDKLSTK